MFQNFSQNNNLILQSNYSIPLLPSGIGENKNLLKLKVKSSLNFFLGINTNNSGKIEFDKFFLENESENLNQILTNKKELKEFIKSKLKENIGLKISVFSDVKRGEGLGFAGNFASLVAIGIFLLNKDINSIEEVDNKLDEIYQLASKIEKILKFNNTNGENSRLAFEGEIGPYLFFQKENNYTLKQLKDIDLSSLNLNIYLINSGKTIKSSLQEKLIENDKREIQEILEYKNELFSNKNFLFTNKNIYKNIEETFSFLNLKFIKLLSQLSSYPNKTYLIDEILQTIKNEKDILEIVGDNSYFAKVFQEKFYKQYEGKKLAILPLWGARFGGSYLVFTNIEEKNINQILRKILQDFPNSKIVYKLDNKKNTNKPKLIQYLDKNIFATKSKKVLINLKTNEKIILDKNTNLSGFDLVLDNIKKRVYIKGKSFNSKQIHSQTQLVNILLKLIEHKKISSDKIEELSYTKSELLGKVIYPFESLMEEFTGYKIKIKINGKMFHYDLVGEGLGKLKIGIIK